MTNRVVYTDLILTFTPADDADGRGVTQQQLVKLCLNMTKQAFDLVGETYSATASSPTIDSEAGFAIIQSAASRIANHLHQWHKRQIPYPPEFLFTEHEERRLLELVAFDIDYIDGE
jgi:hypothetical protein